MGGSASAMTGAHRKPVGKIYKHSPRGDAEAAPITLLERPK